MVAPQISQEKITVSEVNMEKQTEVATRGRDLCGRRGLLSLCFYAGAVTAALVVVIVLGNVYLKQSKELWDTQQEIAAAQCSQNPDTADPGDEDGETRHMKIKMDNDLEEDEIIESRNGRYETILSSQPNSSQVLITVIDHLRGMAGVYNPINKECYLMGGMTMNISGGMKPDSDGVIKIKGEDAVSLEVLYDEQVADKSLLPRQLHEVCREKPTYWMQHSISRGLQPRHKRAVAPVAVGRCTCRCCCCVIVIIIRKL